MLRERLGPHGVSIKGLQRRERRLADIAAGKRAIDSVDTLQVLLIRIAFENDRSGSLTSVTEDGNFLLRDAVQGEELFDRPPHDKAYFQAHLQGLAEYWRVQSSGRLQVEARVLPEGDEDAYLLSDIADYGPGKGGFWEIDGLVRLVQDMITAADEGTQADGSVNLSDYDFDDPNTYLIFAHAGGDIQSNLVYDEGDPDYSPNDIPTFFVQLGDDDQVDLTSTDPDTQEPGRVLECSVIPESTNQDLPSMQEVRDATPDGEDLIFPAGSIAAALYHEFGHALGLPDLYSTFTGLPSLGYWDLMDSGTNLSAGVQVPPFGGCDAPINSWSVIGLLPPGISAWCKWYLGWTDPIVAGGRVGKMGLNPSFDPALDDRVLLLDVSPDEFFLVENRWIPPVIPQGESWFLQSDPDTGVILFLGKDGDNGVENTNMYDFYMPWLGGLMVYRVRQDRIDATIRINTVQAFRESEGLTLVEADGIQDIGVFEFTTRGFWGSDADAFRAGSTVSFSSACGPARIEFPFTSDRFDDFTTPSSWSSFRLPTGVIIEGIPESSGDGMFFNAGIEGYVDLNGGIDDPVFPLRLSDAVDGEGNLIPIRGDAKSIVTAVVRGTDGIFMAGQAADGSSPPAIYGFNLNAAPHLAFGERLLDLDAPLAGPIIADPEFVAPDQRAMISVTRAGTVYATVGATILNGMPAFHPGFPAALGMEVDQPPTLLHQFGSSYVVASSRAENRIRLVDQLGTVHDEWDANFPFAGGDELASAPIAADLDADGEVDELVFLASNRLHATEPNGVPLSGFPLELPATLDADSLAANWLVAWPDEDGLPDRVALVGAESGTGRVLLASLAASTWQLQILGRPLDGPPAHAPSLGDLDGDGQLELVVATQQRVWVRNDGGADLRGWPIQPSDMHWVDEYADEGIASSPLVVDVDSDGLNELVLSSRYGLIHAVEHDGTEAASWPRKASGRVDAPLVMDFEQDGVMKRALLLYESLGDSLARGAQTRSARLNALDLGPKQLASPGPAEWTAWGGSALRSFRRGMGEPSANTRPTKAIRDQSPAIYPNPAREGVARVRFYAGSNHEVSVTLYNLEGEQVLSERESVQGGSTREVALSTDDLVPGAYICRLEYVGASGRTTDVMTFFIER